MSALVSVPKAAKDSGIPYSTLLRLIHEKKLRAVSLPGRRSFLIDPVDIEALIEGSKTGTAPGTEVENKPSEVIESRAPKKRCRTSRKPHDPADKYEWMQRYGYKTERK